MLRPQMTLTRSTSAIAVVVLVIALLITPPANAAPAPAGSTWSETYISTPDGESLHTDVLRPAGFTDADKTPVILIVSPYIGDAAGPSNRFYDFIEGAKVFEHGYSVVQVSLRGTGGSSGCLDILGPGEQTDVVTAVKWAASQPWSNGRVGMYGKSYDANTGVVGAAMRPPGLHAVVAQQITPDRYRGSYSDRVRLLQSVAYPLVSYGSGAEAQGMPGRATAGDATYTSNALAHSADCQAGLAEHYVDDESINFWRARDFVERAKGSTVPTFVTTGYVDNNTNIGGGAVEFFNALAGPKQMWIGWWDHVRGNDMVGDRLAMGRQGWYEAVLRFYDEHLKGIAPTVKDPVIAAQGSDGEWRTEQSFPPADAVELETSLGSGSYDDDGTNEGSRSSGPGGAGASATSATGAGVWTFSPPLAHEAHAMGFPDASINLTPRVPRTNLAVNVYDVDPDGNATMITRGAALVDAAGAKHVPLWPTDWTFEAGHRVGVLVSGANIEAYTHVPTNTTVTVVGGTVKLPWLSVDRVRNLDGDPAPRLESWKSQAPFPVAAATIEANTDPAFNLPPAQQ